MVYGGLFGHYTLSGRIGKVVASHAAVARSSPAEVARSSPAEVALIYTKEDLYIEEHKRG